MSAGIPSSTAQVQKSAEMSTSASSNGSDLGIESTDIKTATGVSLSSQQRVLVGSVLDVFLPRSSFPFKARLEGGGGEEC
jgi:hypothetical protein